MVQQAEHARLCVCAHVHMQRTTRGGGGGPGWPRMNRTVRSAKHVHGKDPQLLVEKIIRERIFDSRYWKESCFGLDTERLMELAVRLDHVGGTYANQKPTAFLCLLLRMLQLQPDTDVVLEFIQQEDFKYLRALGLFYFRLVGSPAASVYRALEPHLGDRRKLRLRQRNGTFALTHVDELVDQLLQEDRVYDIILPRLASRMVLEETEDLEPREPLLADFADALEELEDVAETGSSGGGARDVSGGGGGARDSSGGGALDLSVEATNALRAQLGLKPLQ